MKIITGALLTLLLLLQYPLWLGKGNMASVWSLRQEVATQREKNDKLATRNAALAAEVVDLKQGLDAIEERARLELGMIKTGEIFYQVIEH